MQAIRSVALAQDGRNLREKGEQHDASNNAARQHFPKQQFKVVSVIWSPPSPSAATPLRVAVLCAGPSAGGRVSGTSDRTKVNRNVVGSACEKKN